MLGFKQAGRSERGDTLIEVLFAITIFSMIVVGALALMNQGTAASRRALETTIARQAMDAQAETLRFMHESYVANYQSGATYNTTDATTSPAEEYFKIIQSARPRAGATATNLTTCPATAPANSFVVNPANAAVVTTNLQAATVYPELVYNASGALTASRGIWIEALYSNGGSAAAGVIDFHIRACWQTGNVAPVTLGTIVRLYEPRG